MIALKKYSRSISYLLTVIICLQGCTVYKKSVVTLDEAPKSGLKVKVEKTDDIILYFTKIEERNDGNFYGLRNRFSKGAEINRSIILNDNNISKVRIKDRKQSTIMTIITSVALAGLTGAAIYAASWKTNN